MIGVLAKNIIALYMFFVWRAWNDQRIGKLSVLPH